jgi:hypothetical protein
MAKKPSLTTASALFFEGKPKKTRQGRSINTKLSASSRNGRKKRYRGQGSV